MIKENNDVYKQPGSPYSPGDEPLSAEDAIRAMLEGETLHDDEGKGWRWDKFNCLFGSPGTDDVMAIFENLRRPAKRTRLMTRWEALAWANSEESRGWVVSEHSEGAFVVYTQHNWRVPQFFNYDTSTFTYFRARLLPDLSGVDKDTIQGFEVGE